MMKFDAQIIKERCKGCALCVAACAKSLIRMTERLNHQGYPCAEMTDNDKCTGCRQCADMCPDLAIRITREGDPSGREPAAENSGPARKQGI